MSGFKPQQLTRAGAEQRWLNTNSAHNPTLMVSFPRSLGSRMFLVHVWPHRKFSQKEPWTHPPQSDSVWGSSHRTCQWIWYSRHRIISPCLSACQSPYRDTPREEPSPRSSASCSVVQLVCRGVHWSLRALSPRCLASPCLGGSLTGGLVGLDSACPPGRDLWQRTEGTTESGFVCVHVCMHDRQVVYAQISIRASVWVATWALLVLILRGIPRITLMDVCKV